MNLARARVEDPLVFGFIRSGILPLIHGREMNPLHHPIILIRPAVSGLPFG